jgi:monovalent cation:H+ antiporter, CPA1 family
MEHAAQEMVLLLILLLCVIVWDTIEKVRWIPSSVVAVTLGMIVAAFSVSNDTPFMFAPDLFLYLMLPIILLNSSFKFRPESLRRTWLSSMMFAWVGTLLTIMLIAWGILTWTSMFNMKMTFVDSLLIASLLAPTDTVATLMLSKSLDDPFIAEVMENEAVLNDAISVVLVRLFANMSEQHQQLNRWVPLRAVGTSMLFMCLSALVGYLSAKIVRRLHLEKPSIHFIVALIVYGCCEFIGISGIVGLFTYGSLVNPPKIVSETVENVSVIIEAYVYLTLGLSVHALGTDFLLPSFLILVSCLASRVLVVFMLGGCLRCCGREQWTVPSLLFFSMCGIRGAISFAMCMGLMSEWRDFIQSTAFVVIVTTIISMGTLQKCMHKLLLEPYKTRLRQVV